MEGKSSSSSLLSISLSHTDTVAPFAQYSPHTRGIWKTKVMEIEKSRDGICVVGKF